MQASFSRKTQGVKTRRKSLAKLESHFCRAAGSKLYLEPVFESMSSLQKEYKHVCSRDKITSKNVFNEVFCALNLGLFAPKIDQCDLCCGQKVRIVLAHRYNQSKPSLCSQSYCLQNCRQLRYITRRNWLAIISLSIIQQVD